MLIVNNIQLIINKIGLVSCLVIVISACRKDLIYPNEVFTYIHLSHTRLDSNPNIDQIIETKNFSDFDMLFLGGDLAYLTSKDEQTISHVNSIFDLGKPTTLWSLGNHDYSNLERIYSYTNRPNYYAYYKNDICFLVLDTQVSKSRIEGDQLKFVNQVLDTISMAKHLIVLHHKLLWMRGNTDLEHLTDKFSNGIKGDCSHCLNDNNFYQDIYPRLIKTKKMGLNVICLAGDLGSKIKSFSHQTDEGIYFLASGIKANTENNLCLIFKHDITQNILEWSFVSIDSL